MPPRASRWQQPQAIKTTMELTDPPEYVSEGTFGCVLRNVPKCPDAKNPKNKKYVSKIFSSSADANTEIEKYALMRDTLDATNKFTIENLGVCDIPDFERFKKRGDVHKCKKLIARYDKKKDYMKKQTKNEHVIPRMYQVMIEDAGVDLFAIMHDRATRFTFELIFAKLDPVFKGLVDMNARGYAHCDVKTDNIMFDRNEMKLIDYGLVTKKADVGIDIYQPTSAAYVSHYPPDFTMYHLIYTLMDRIKENAKFIQDERKRKVYMDTMRELHSRWQHTPNEMLGKHLEEWVRAPKITELFPNEFLYYDPTYNIFNVAQYSYHSFIETKQVARPIPHALQNTSFEYLYDQRQRVLYELGGGYFTMDKKGVVHLTANTHLGSFVTREYRHFLILAQSKLDVYCLGLTLFSVFTNMVANRKCAMIRDGNFIESLSSLIHRMTHFDVRKRLTMRQAYTEYRDILQTHLRF